MWSFGRSDARRKENLCKLITTAAALAMTVLARGTTAQEVSCTHSDEFFYSLPGSRCGAYYRCYQNQPIYYSCTDGAMFDFYQQRCVRTEGTCYEAICVGKTNGLYADTSQGCHRSYRCRGGKITTIENCPQGMRFDGNVCTTEEDVVCESPEATAASIRYEADPRCYGLADGNHVLPSDGLECTKYLLCADDQVLDVLECPSGYRFDERSKRCRLSSQGTSCRTSDQFHDWKVADENGCNFLPDGYHLAVTSYDCRSYVKCQSRRLVGRHECPSMTIFNGQQCVPSFLHHCPRLDVTGDICQHRNDGYQVDPRKGCAYYVRCQAKRTVEQHSCPNGFHYDALENVCREAVLDTTCHQIPYSTDCAERASGFYQDFTAMDDASLSPCRAYFHCHNGIKTAFHCEHGYVFDGENCVPQESYQCPVEDVNSCQGKPNGYYQDARAGCRAYHLCTNGNKISYLCEPGHSFIDGKCRHGVRQRTPESLCSTDTPCVERPDGYYQDRDTQCRQYYFCQRGEKLQTLTCRGSKIFDGRTCVQPDSYTCPNAGVDDVDAAASENCIVRHCEPVCTKGGFFADYDSGCERYHFCIDGKQSTLSCSGNYVFNGELCVPKASYYCPRYCTPPESC
uniref:Chitin-binding type-2 domain-containing protein n=1 Tax=Anopheles funestus TaxID=62324 RepID=A0A182RI57_ANOFN